MRREARLLLALAAILTLSALYAMPHEHPEPSVTYTTVTLEPPVPTLPTNTTVEWVGEARLLIYINGKLVVNETDPPTWNWYATAALCSLGAVDGMRIIYKGVTGSTWTISYQSASCSGRYTFKNVRFVLGSGYWPNEYTAINVSSPFFDIPVTAVRFYRGRIYIIAVGFAPAAGTISEVGLYADLYLNVIYDWYYKLTTMLLYHVLENPIYVDKGDNVTLVVVASMPPGKLGECYLHMLTTATTLDTKACSWPQVMLYVYPANTTQLLDCRYDIFYDEYEGYKLVTVCAGVSTLSGDVIFWYTRKYFEGGIHVDGEINITLETPYHISNGQPVVLVWVLHWR